MILSIIKQKPGIKVPEIVEFLNRNNYNINIDKVRNTIKRELSKLIIYKGSNKKGGYYIK